MKANYQVIARGGIKIDSFKATEKEAEAYWRLNYDPEFTKYEELELPDLSDIKVYTNGEYVELYNGKKVFFAQYIEEEKKFIQLDENGYSISEEDITNYLLEFDNFKRLCICEYCENKGYFERYEGDISKIEVCECEYVEYELE